MLGGYYLGRLYLGISGEISAGVLTVQNSDHAHDVTNITLVQQHTVSIDNSSHSLTSDILDLIENKTLVITNASHGLVSDNVSLTQAHILVLSNAAHALTSDNLVLSQQQLLVIANASHNHSVDGLLNLNQFLLLNQPDPGVFLVNSPQIVVSQNHVLAIANSVHALYGSALSIFDWASHNLYAGVYILDSQKTGTIESAETEIGNAFVKQDKNVGVLIPAESSEGVYLLTPMQFGKYK